MRVRALFLLLFFIGLTSVGLGTGKAFAYTPEECIACHREPGTDGSSVRVRVEAYEQSVHGRKGMVCTDCHKAIQGKEHESGAGSAAVSCTECHTQENRHGMGSDARPQCYSCHTRHHILGKDDPGSSVASASLKQTCAACHPAECGKIDSILRLTSWQVSSHGKGDFGGVYARDNCIGCHQGAAVHGEQGPVDGQQCMRCHGAMAGVMHPRADMVKQPGVTASAAVQALLLFMFLGAGGVFWVQWLSGAKRRCERKEPHDHHS